MDVLASSPGAELPEELTAYAGFDPEAFDRKEVDAILGRVFGEG